MTSFESVLKRGSKGSPNMGGGEQRWHCKALVLLEDNTEINELQCL